MVLVYMVLVYMVLVKVIVCMFTFFHVKIITQEGKPPDLKIGVRNWKPLILSTLQEMVGYREEKI